MFNLLYKNKYEKRGIKTQLNPAHSPDMNPTEMMWSILKR